MKYETPEDNNGEKIITGNENTVKISTIVLFVLGLIVPLWIVTLPLFWFWAYCTFKSGQGSVVFRPDTSVVAKKAETNKEDKFDQIAKLKKLLDEGALTEEEFNQEKAKLLN